jgi:hypothetical protein
MNATPTGIAGAVDHAPSRSSACHVCGGEMESPHALRGMPGVGIVAACSRECTSADGFRSEGERARTAAATHVEQLIQEIRDLKNQCKRHAGNIVEAHAFAVDCQRHLPKMRGCSWVDNQACDCRAAVVVHFPEYRDA